VEELGGEAWLPTIAEWFFYTNFRRKEDDLVRRDYKTFMLDWLKDRWQRRVEHRIHGALKDELKNHHEAPISRIFEYANPFLYRTVEGEGVLSVGKAIDFALKGASGVINVMPFTCMPGTNVSAVMLRVKEKYGNIPFLNMAYDGLEQTTARTRLEAFMHQAHQYMLQKSESS
jgi:predicted nucleotide-binding protein (sugar kinase/HSP70/actin superfamily)